MSYEIHQRELRIKICQIVNADATEEWTPEKLAARLDIPVGSNGYQRILEVLAQMEREQSEESRKIKIGFI